MAINRLFDHEEEWEWERTERREKNQENFEQISFSFEENLKENNLKEFYSIVNSAFTVGDMVRICNIIDGKEVGD